MRPRPLVVMELETHDSCLAVLTVVLPSSVWGSRVFKMARRCLVLALVLLCRPLANWFMSYLISQVFTPFNNDIH